MLGIFSHACWPPICWSSLSHAFFFSFFYHLLLGFWASLVAQMVKNLPAVQETWVQPLGWEDPLEKGMAIHSTILAWKIPWTV